MKFLINYIYYKFEKIVKSKYFTGDYFNLIKKFLIEINSQIIIIKNIFFKFKHFLYNINLLQFILMVYLFFIGIIPIIIIIFFWLFIIYTSIYIIFLIFDLFIFNLLLIYSNNNKYIVKIYYIFLIIKDYSLFLLLKIYYIFLYIIQIILYMLSYNWWILNIKKYIIKPIDKVLCKILDNILKILINLYTLFKLIILYSYKSSLIIKDRWILVYKPNIKKYILKIKLLQFTKIYWFKYFSELLKIYLIIKYFLLLLLNKWFWLYITKFYFYNIFIRDKIIKIKFYFYNLISYKYIIKMYKNKNLLNNNLLFYYQTLIYKLNIINKLIFNYIYIFNLYKILNNSNIEKDLSRIISIKLVIIKDNLRDNLLVNHKYLYIYYKLYKIIKIKK